MWIYVDFRTSIAGTGAEEHRLIRGAQLLRPIEVVEARRDGGKCGGHEVRPKRLRAFLRLLLCLVFPNRGRRSSQGFLGFPEWPRVDGPPWRACSNAGLRQMMVQRVGTPETSRPPDIDMNERLVLVKIIMCWHAHSPWLVLQFLLSFQPSATWTQSHRSAGCEGGQQEIG